MSMEPFLKRACEGRETAMGGVLQEGLNYYARQIKALLDTFPEMDAPMYLAAMKSIHDVFRNMMQSGGPEAEDNLLEHMTAVAIPVRRQK